MTMIVTLGEILVEIMATERGQGFGRAGTFRGPFPSGAPAIFIDQVGRLGQACGIIACVGDDEFGRATVERLAADGVDVSAIAVDRERATGSAFVSYRPDGERDFIFNMRHAACASLALDPAARALLGRAGHLHLVGSSLFSPALVAVASEAAAIVKAAGGTLSFDPNVRKEMLDAPGMREAQAAMLMQCDLFLPSGPELLLLTEATSEDEAIARLLADGVTAVVVKRGDAGASYHDRQGGVTMPAFAVAEVDPTGAGDCFGAAFMVCRLRGLDPATCLRYANAAGALTVTRQGPMEGAATLAQLDAFIATATTAA